jgi:selenocysteine-specific elongation factor
MKSVILGTAGHVDHGKTTLIEALTGINTDRWEEERDRGITIDLGFAPFPSDSDDLEISVVDVPGHEDFVKNMLAGATGVDLLLLVVAADEGPMPQTREHLWIARLLGVEHGVVAISKCDLVDDEWRDLVIESVGEEIRRVFGEVDWPVVEVSTVSGEGLDDLRDAILQAARLARARDDDDLFRLPADRSFSVRGVGTVVTGTVWSGRVTSGDEVRILPAGRRTRVRGIQVHGRAAESAHAGQRAAIALVGVERSEIGRGDTLTIDPVWRTTRFVDAMLHVVPDSQWTLKHWQRVRFHLGTAETLARLVLLDGERLAPGAGSLVQFRLEEPVVARAGDRFVLRFYSPVTTIGGGVIVDPWAPRRSRLRPAEPTPEMDRAQRLLLAVSRAGAASPSELAILAGGAPADLAVELSSLAETGSVRELAGRWFPTDALDQARLFLLQMLEQGHASDAGARGVSLESLRSAARWPADLVNAALSDLEADGTIRIAGALAALASHIPKLSPHQESIAAAAIDRIRQAGLAPPSVKELASALGCGEDDLLPVLKFLLDQGRLVAVTADLYYDPGAITEVQKRVGRVLGSGGAATPSELREALGVTRKYLIPLLEHLDAAGFTQRTPEGRTLREEKNR